MLDLSENSAPESSRWQAIAHWITDHWHQMMTTLFAGFHDSMHSISQFNDRVWAQLRQSAHQIAVAVTNFTAPLASADLWQVVLYWVLVVVALAGVVGAFVPALPGVTLIVGSVLLWGLIKGFAGLGWAVGIAIAALILSIAIDYLAGIIGAQKVGASAWGQTGAVVGMVLGFFGLIPALPIGGPILGILVGTVLGAFVGEFLHRRELELWPRTKQSFRVGIAIVVGTLVGNILQGFLATIAFVVFLLTSWSTVYGG